MRKILKNKRLKDQQLGKRIKALKRKSLRIISLQQCRRMRQELNLGRVKRLRQHHKTLHSLRVERENRTRKYLRRRSRKRKRNSKLSLSLSQSSKSLRSKLRLNPPKTTQMTSLLKWLRAPKKL